MKTENIELKYNPGDIIEWTSSANRTTKVKRGIVIAYLPRNGYANLAVSANIYKVLGDLEDFSWRILGQNHSLAHRYLVAVERIGKNGKPTFTLDIYTPNIHVAHKGKLIKKAK